MSNGHFKDKMSNHKFINHNFNLSEYTKPCISIYWSQCPYIWISIRKSIILKKIMKIWEILLRKNIMKVLTLKIQLLTPMSFMLWKIM